MYFTLKKYSPELTPQWEVKMAFAEFVGPSIKV
jgi:hypothetical protein